MSPPSPSPSFYLSTGNPVTCLTFLPCSSQLLVGTSTGSLQVWSCSTWRKLEEIQLFVKGVLWVGMVGSDMVVCQGRMESVKLLKREEGDTWTVVNEFAISHDGFCKGIIMESGSSTLLACPSGQSGLMVSRLKEIYIRPVVTLDPDKGRNEAVEEITKHGSLMAVSEGGPSLLLAVYEGGQLLVWDWSNCRVMARMDMGVVGTPMAMAYDREKGNGVVGGSENKVVSFCLNKTGEDAKTEIDNKNDAEPTLCLLKTREIANSGVGSAGIRQDGKIAVTGGWDGRVRIFSWMNPAKMKPLAVLQFHSGSVETVAFTSQPPTTGRCTTNLLAAGGKDSKVSLWSIYN